jgi:hypothetical protein
MLNATNRMLERLKLPFVEQEEYINLRCVWTLGCLVEIRPYTEEAATIADDSRQLQDDHAGSFYKAVFEDLLPNIEVPEEVGSSCCAQFAVTAARVRQRPKSDYENYRRWLLETYLDDAVSARIMEYMWHSKLNFA